MRTILALALSALAAGCIGQGSDPELATASVAAPPFLAVVDLAPNGMEYEFNPAQLVVALGREVRLTVHNTGYLPHSYVVHELGVDSGELAPDEKTVVTFTPRAPGSYGSMCDVSGHYEAGMSGTLVVRDS